MVGNPQMEDIQKLTADNFTEDTGITVNFTVLPENELRDKVTQDVATQARPVRRGHHRRYEAPIWAQERLAARAVHATPTRTRPTTRRTCSSRWSQSLSGDDGKLYAAPFYGESSFLMYSKDLFAGRA